VELFISQDLKNGRNPPDGDGARGVDHRTADDCRADVITAPMLVAVAAVTAVAVVLLLNCSSAHSISGR
jgi:hypothetical protein